MKPAKKLFLLWTALELVLFFVFVLPYLLHPNSLDVYDAPSQLALARFLRDELFPSYLGWNPNSLLGFPQGLFYPPLLHWLAAFLGFIFDLKLVFKGMIAASLLGTPIAAYFWIRKYFQLSEQALLGTILVSCLLIVLPGYLGAGWKGVVQIGLIPSFVSLPILLALFGLFDRGKYRLSVLLLSAVILLHLVAAAVAVLYVAASLLNTQTRASAVKVLGLSLVITSFFWLPFLIFSSEISVSRHPEAYLFFNLAVFWIAISLAFINKFQGKTVYLITIALAALLLIDKLGEVLPNVASEKIYSFHLYRFQAYLAIFFSVLAFGLIFKFLKITSKQALMLGSVGVILLAGYGLIRNPVLSSGDRFNLVEKDPPGERFIEAFSREESYPFIYASQEELGMRGSQWAYGLFTDSVRTGPYLGSVAYSLSQEELVPERSEFIETQVISEEKVEQALNLFGVDHLLILGEEGPGAVGESSLLDQKGYYHLQQRDSIDLIETINTPLSSVQDNWEEAFESWWRQTDSFSELLVADPKGTLGKVDEKAKGKIVEISHNETWSTFDFKVDSDQEIPVLVKFSYFPFWRANNEGKEIPIYRVSPNLMLVVTKGKVEFNYDQPDWIIWLFALGFLTALLTLTRREFFKTNG